MGARYYDPTFGQFLSPDPVGYTSSVSLYAYADGDPINFFDPTGRLAQKAWDPTKATVLGVWNNPRFQGSLLMAGGLGELGVAGFMGATTAPTGVGLVGAGLLATHGADNIQAGFRQMFTGQQTDTILEGAMQDLGMSQGSAHMASAAFGFFAPAGVVKAPFAMSRVAAASKGYGAVGGISILNRSAQKQGISVLGHFPEYVDMSKKLNARYFDIPLKIWDKMPESQRWQANQKFLDRMIQRMDRILLATPPKSARKGTFYMKELKYLDSKGFKPSPSGEYMLRSR